MMRVRSSSLIAAHCDCYVAQQHFGSFCLQAQPGCSSHPVHLHSAVTVWHIFSANAVDITSANALPVACLSSQSLIAFTFAVRAQLRPSAPPLGIQRRRVCQSTSTFGPVKSMSAAGKETPDAAAGSSAAGGGNTSQQQDGQSQDKPRAGTQMVGHKRGHEQQGLHSMPPVAKAPRHSVQGSPGATSISSEAAAIALAVAQEVGAMPAAAAGHSQATAGASPSQQQQQQAVVATPISRHAAAAGPSSASRPMGGSLSRQRDELSVALKGMVEGQQHVHCTGLHGCWHTATLPGNATAWSAPSGIADR